MPPGTEEEVSPTLAAWLSERLEEEGPFSLVYLSGGNSNETLLLESPRARNILRRPPQATLSPSAHSMEREFRVLGAVADTPVPAPTPRALATPDDEGGPFLVMEFVDGFAVLDDLPPGYPPGLESLREVGERVVEALATMHSVDWRAAGLEGFGRPDGFLERQVGRWRGQFESYQVREIADFDWLCEWLEANRPPAQQPGIIHGDFHLDNCLFSRQPPIAVKAIIDWEMATIGDPLLDLGLLLGLWGPDRGSPPAIDNLQGVSRVEGAPTREHLARHYAEHSGRSVEQIDWYTCLALWKLGAVIEGAYAHYVNGSVDSDYAKSLEADVPRLMAEARQIAEAS